MSKFPLLEQLRAERERSTMEITATLRDALSNAQARISSLQDILRTLETMIGSEIARHVIARAAEEIESAVRRKITEACATAARSQEPITLTLNADVVRWMDPASLEREVLDRFAIQTLPNLSLRVASDHNQAVMIMDICIPEMGYRHAMDRTR